MNTRSSLLTVVAVVLMTAIPSGVSSQDLDDPLDEWIEESPIEPEDTLVPILKALPEIGSLDTLMHYLKKSEMDDRLTGNGPFTLFAPCDSAFAGLTGKQHMRLVSDRQFLRDVIGRHIVAGQAVIFGDEDRLTVKAVSGDDLTILVSGDSVQVEQAWVIGEQIKCSNGVIHVIDAVLLPSKGTKKG